MASSGAAMAAALPVETGLPWRSVSGMRFSSVAV
jgi:hypothetical protein